MIYNLSHIFEGFQNRMKAKMKVDAETNFIPEDAINFPVITTQDTGNKVMLKYEKFLYELGYEFTHVNNNFIQFSIMKGKLVINLYLNAEYYNSISETEKFFSFDSYIHIEQNFSNDANIKLIDFNKSASEKNINEFSQLNFNKFLLILKNMKTTKFKSMVNELFEMFYKYKNDIRNIFFKKYGFHPIIFFTDILSENFIHEYLWSEWNLGKYIDKTDNKQNRDMILYNAFKEAAGVQFNEFLEKYNLK